MKQPTKRSTNPLIRRSRQRRANKGPALSADERAELKKVALREEKSSVRVVAQKISNSLKRQLTVTENGAKTPSLEMVPTPLPVDSYENIKRDLNERGLINMAMAFIQQYLALTRDISGTSAGSVLNFGFVLTLIVNAGKRAARGELTGTERFPDWMAFFLVAIQEKSGLDFLGRKVSYSFQGIAADSTEVISYVFPNSHAYVNNADRLTTTDPALTGGFRPLVPLVPTSYDEPTAARDFMRMCQFMKCNMVSLDKMTSFHGCNPRTTGDAFCINLQPSIVVNTSSVLDTQVGQLRKKPDYPILAVANLVATKTDATFEDTKDYVMLSSLGCGPPAFWQAVECSRWPKAIAGKSLREELIKAVPLYVKDIFTYVIYQIATAMKNDAFGLDPTIIPNSLDFAVAVYNGILSFFGVTTRAFGGMALPRASTTAPGVHPVVVNLDAATMPSASSSKVIFNYQIVEAFRSYYSLETDQAPSGDHTYRRVPVLWTDADFVPSTYVEELFANLGIEVAPAPTEDTGHGDLWGIWNLEKNTWSGGSVENQPVNCTSSPAVDKAIERFNLMMGKVKPTMQITGCFPSTHDITCAKWLRIFNTTGVPRKAPRAFGSSGDNYTDGVVYTDDHPCIDLSDSSSFDDDTAVIIGQYLLPSTPEGIFKANPPKPYNMLFGFAKAINRTDRGSDPKLRWDGFSALTVGNAVVAEASSSELGKSYFTGRIMHAVGGGFYKVGAKEDWSFMKDVEGEGKEFIKELVAQLKARGVRTRVIRRVAKETSRKGALVQVERHIRHRKTFAKVGEYAKQVAEMLVSFVAKLV